VGYHYGTLGISPGSSMRPLLKPHTLDVWPAQKPDNYYLRCKGLLE